MFFQARTLHVLRCISICDLFTDSRRLSSESYGAEVVRFARLHDFPHYTILFLECRTTPSDTSRFCDDKFELLPYMNRSGLTWHQQQDGGCRCTSVQLGTRPLSDVKPVIQPSCLKENRSLYISKLAAPNLSHKINSVVRRPRNTRNKGEIEPASSDLHECCNARCEHGQRAMSASWCPYVSW